KKPPPYEKEVRFEEVYPQLPVISQEGAYHIRDEDGRTIEKGKAETTIKTYPSSKSKKETASVRAKRELRIRRRDFGGDDDLSDLEEVTGGYYPAVRRMLSKAEIRGETTRRKEDSGDGDGDSEKVYWLRKPKSIGEVVEGPADTEEGVAERRLSTSRDEVCIVFEESENSGEDPVVVRGQSLEYKPWQNTDMSDILEKLPSLQDGAHPWISKLEEILVGTQPAVGDIKRLLANLLGVPATEEIFRRQDSIGMWDFCE
ncbi:hypothetical protein NFI96_019342, partial [Prochilodus magdalenae]